MSLRTKSRTSQWGCWTLLFLAGLGTYAIGLRLIGSETGAWLIFARQNVAAFAAASFVFGWLAYELRWDGIVREEEETKEPEVAVEERGKEEKQEAAPIVATPVADAPLVEAAAASEPLPGEAEWLEACELPHAYAPTVATDSRYLTLVKRSADLGYQLAMAELGDYALVFQAFIEAYYWYSCAQKQGMRNLDARLRDICRNWKLAGCPSQQHWYLLEDPQAQSIACALFDRDTGRNAKAAADYLASVGFA